MIRYNVEMKSFIRRFIALFFIAIVLSLLSKGIPELSVITIYAFYIAIGMTLFAGIMYGKNIICKDFKE